jgi:hypothetical protein
VRVLSRLLRRLFLDKLVAAHRAAELQFFNGHAALVDPQSFAAFLAPLPILRLAQPKLPSIHF